MSKRKKRKMPAWSQYSFQSILVFSLFVRPSPLSLSKGRSKQPPSHKKIERASCKRTTKPTIYCRCVHCLLLITSVPSLRIFQARLEDPSAPSSSSCLKTLIASLMKEPIRLISTRPLARMVQPVSTEPHPS